MNHLAEVLHELIDAARHTLTPNRVGELHALADKAAGVAKDAEQAAETVAEVTGAPADVPAGA